MNTGQTVRLGLIKDNRYVEGFRINTAFPDHSKPLLVNRVIDFTHCHQVNKFNRKVKTWKTKWERRPRKLTPAINGSPWCTSEPSLGEDKLVHFKTDGSYNLIQRSWDNLSNACLLPADLGSRPIGPFQYKGKKGLCVIYSKGDTIMVKSLNRVMKSLSPRGRRR